MEPKKEKEAFIGPITVAAWPRILEKKEERKSVQVLK